MAKLAVIGLGKMGLLHAGLFSALQDQPISIASEEDGLLARLARKIMPRARVYQDYNEMISKEELDAVVIATPVQTHAQIILDILDRRPGLSIFVEEPLAATYADARKVCEAARDSSGVQMVGFQRRYTATFRRARELLANGNIGTPWYFKCYYLMSDIFKKEHGWRFKKETGGVMIEAGPHLFDLIIWIFGEPSNVTGVSRRFVSEEVEDYVHCSMSFPNDLAGYADISWTVRNFRSPAFQIEVEGTNGKLEVSDSFLNVQLDGQGPDLPAGTHVLSRPVIQPSVPFLLGAPEFCLEDQEFLSALRAKKQPETDFPSAAKVNLWIDRIRNS
jgi:predicted dehydrogenase